MADKTTKQLKQSVLQEDLDAYAGMQGITGYDPANASFNAASGTGLKTTMQASQGQEVQDYAAWQASRDKKVADEWAFHDFVRKMRIVSQSAVLRKLGRSASRRFEEKERI